ncbi:MAG: SIS domain-containing protein [Angelakisella sp.]|nr:SIS domain-containing protein [Angelakisella sp.]
MISKESDVMLKNFIETVKTEFDNFSQTIENNTYDEAAKIILEAEKNGNRVHITGIGKPSHIASYMASLLSSTGTPTYFLHGTEAVHGSCGQLVKGDVVICISNSGETAELKSTVIAIKNNGCKVIAVTGNPNSWLARVSDAHLFAGVKAEGGPLNRAPRSSILAEALILQGLSVVLQSIRGVTPQQYITWHPGGTLGALRDNEKEEELIC